MEKTQEVISNPTMSLVIQCYLPDEEDPESRCVWHTQDGLTEDMAVYMMESHLVAEHGLSRREAVVKVEDVAVAWRVPTDDAEAEDENLEEEGEESTEESEDVDEVPNNENPEDEEGESTEETEDVDKVPNGPGGAVP